MTHDELLVSIERMTNHDAIFMKDALRAVVELHAPLTVKDTPHLTYCQSCQEMYIGTYPCATIQAIEGVLK